LDDRYIKKEEGEDEEESISEWSLRVAREHAIANDLNPDVPENLNWDVPGDILGASYQLAGVRHILDFVSKKEASFAVLESV